MDKPIYTVIQTVDLYKEGLEPAWEYPDPNDQWLFAQPVTEYIGEAYNILYVYADNTFTEVQHLRRIPKAAKRSQRTDVDYDEIKTTMQKRPMLKSLAEEVLKIMKSRG